MRELDEPIPDAERLFRGAHRDDVQGESVSIGVIDSEGTSCNRNKFSGPASVLNPEKGLTKAVAATPGTLPSPIVGSNGVEYEFFAVDAPEDGRDAHCEIRWRRTSDRPSREHVKVTNKGVKLQLKTVLARCFWPVPDDEM